MKNNATFILIITVLVMAGSYGVYSIFQQNTPYAEKISAAQNNMLDTSTNKIESPTRIAEEIPDPILESSVNNDFTDVMSETIEMLEQSRYSAAVEFVDSFYQQLSTKELEEFDNLFISTAFQLWQTGKTLQAIDLLTHHTEAFNSLDSWNLLSTFQLKSKNWLAAIDSLQQAFALEYQPDKLKTITDNLIVAASSQRALLEAQKDELGINLLYKNLYEFDPENTRFQLELAYSYMRLKDNNNARNLLELLQYDSEYAALANSALLSLNNDTAAISEQKSEPTPNQNEIVIPLLRSGNSFFAKTTINNRDLRLLLDTGASITSLSTKTIQSLNLEPTGRSIQLSTANGITRAQLYKADQIRLGRLRLRNLVVAEIEFDKNSQIHGLLGTDLLNQLDSRYSYIIDNQKNALIFKPKN